jgi:hypothetical protein
LFPRSLTLALRSTDNPDVTSSAPQPPPAAPTLSPAQVQQQFAAAHLAATKVRRAAGVATGDGWMIAVFGGLTFLFGLSGDLSGLLLGGAMCAIAFIEIEGAKRIRRLDPTVAKRLAYNQLALAAVLICYSLWSLHQASTGGLSAELKAHEQELGAMGKEADDIVKLAYRILYFTLIAVAIFAQGGMALYYFSREKYIRRYVEQTPSWILEMQRNGTPL